MDAEAPAHRARRLCVVTDRPYVPLCRHGHGPLDAWRTRRRTHRGRYCRACNQAAFRRWYDTHKRRPR